MNLLIGLMAKLGLLKEDLDYHLKQDVVRVARATGQINLVMPKTSRAA
jgi:hypothetical protein